MNFKYRKSKSKDDSLSVAKWLKDNFDIAPYTEKELFDVVRSGIRSGEIELIPSGLSSEIINIDEWFLERIKPNTVSISEKMYKQALYRAFRLIALGNIAKIDFRYPRQRDFGQMLTDFTRGFLGEIVLEQFLQQRFGSRIDLEEKQIGEVEQFLATDVPYVWENGKRRKSKLNFSIKTSKLPSLWLDISTSQISYSDIFCFIKIGLQADHFKSFMKNVGFVKRLVEIAVEVEEIPAGSAEKELKLLFSKIPSISSWSSYVVGFLEQAEFKKGNLVIANTRSRKKIIGGYGFYEGTEADEVEGLRKISGNRYLASCGVLKWDQQSWEFLLKKM